MTFRPETNPKDSADDKKQQQQNSCGGAQNGNQQCPVTHISTIYDPRLRCAQAPPLSFATIVPVFSSTKKSCPGGTPTATNGPKKTVVETIKKITCKLYSRSKGSSDVENAELEAAQKRMRLIKFICLSILLACKAAIMLAISIFIFRSVQKPEVRDIIVDGEFQILNRNFEYEMLDKESVTFKELAFNLTTELNRLFRKSDVSEYFQRSEILEITPNMTVKCIAIFRSSDNVNVGRIGLAFLRSLRLQHGHTYLGIHTINVQSIGFQIRGEEGIWGEWSDWTGCESPSDHVATRTRKCLTKDTLQVTNVDRCLLIPGNKSDLDILPCKKYLAMMRQREADEFARAIFDSLPADKDNLQLPVQLEEDAESARL